eukprot:TRINITY_DN935_c0_g1_i5.p1 TRINITY_DN935_c0_g1~~TRINITY_DN935_c0_g1_i5.p1  ORF type:complete len:300 (+),score=89.77 TRINITY_DN935_c0_g1_i5:80-979(+)
MNHFAVLLLFCISLHFVAADDNSVLLMKSGSWEVPPRAKTIQVVVWGAGGGGGEDNLGQGGGAGGSGALCFVRSLDVSPGSACTITVGLGGSGGSASTHAPATNGGTTTFSCNGVSLWAAGGKRGGSSDGAGGSGGVYTGGCDLSLQGNWGSSTYGGSSVSSPVPVPSNAAFGRGGDAGTYRGTSGDDGQTGAVFVKVTSETENCEAKKDTLTFALIITSAVAGGVILILIVVIVGLLFWAYYLSRKLDAAMYVPVAQQQQPPPPSHQLPSYSDVESQRNGKLKNPNAEENDEAAALLN